MDFDLREEHRMLKQLCRDFAERVLIPHADEWDRNHRFPVEVFREMARLGLMGLLVPPAYGGAAVGTVGYVAAMEEISRGDQSVAVAWNAHLTIGTLLLLEYGTEEQKRRWLVPIARGEALGAFALTEPDAGSDAASIKTTAVLDGDDWVINGSKMFISNAGTEMSWGVVLLAVTGRQPDGRKRFSAFTVPKGTQGYIIGQNLRKMGWHGVDTRPLTFQNCRVPRDSLLGQEGLGLRQFLAVLDAGRISVAAVALGLAQACLEISLRYATSRVQFGQPISKFQAIQFKLADMAVNVELARLITYKAAWLRDVGRPYAQEAAAAKLWASEMAMRAADEAVQVHGGYGFMEESVVSRYFRDAKALEIGEGTNEIQHLVIARQLGC